MNNKKESIIVVDIDGTIAIPNNRTFYQWHKVGNDIPNIVMRNLLNGFSEKIVYLTGRNKVCFTDTYNWLVKHNFPVANSILCMRESSNYEPSYQFKQSILLDLLKEYTIDMMFDDDDKVINMANELGLLTLKVNLP